MNAIAPSVTDKNARRDAQENVKRQYAAFSSRAYSSFNRFLRKTHKWVAIIVALPLLLILVTGIALQVRKPIDWIQPSTERGVSTYDPGVSQAQILAAAKADPEMRLQGWRDLAVIDYRPKKGIIKARNHDDLETQIDANTGEVVKTQRRWGDLIARLHDGSEWDMRLWLFLPIALLIFYLWISGFYLGVVETVRKLRSSRLRKADTKKPVPKAVDSRSRTGYFNLVGFCLRYHYWLAVIVVFPLMLVTVSGLVLQVRYELPGVDPGLRQGVNTTPQLRYSQVLDIAKAVPDLQVNRWQDIWRIYTYPGQGVMTVRTKRGVVAQIDASTGELLEVTNYSRDFWEDLHQGLIGRHQLHSGNPFGSINVDLRFFVFLPVHLVSMLLWLTGVYYFLKTTFFRRRARRESGAAKRAALNSTTNVELRRPSASAD